MAERSQTMHGPAAPRQDGTLNCRASLTFSSDLGVTVRLHEVLGPGQDLTLVFDENQGWSVNGIAGPEDAAPGTWGDVLHRILHQRNSNQAAHCPILCPRSDDHKKQVGKFSRTTVSLQKCPNGHELVEIQHATEDPVQILASQAVSLAAWLQTLGASRQAALVRKAAQTALEDGRG